MGMKDLKIVVRWVDKNSNPQQKIYTSKNDAYRARNYLLKNGVENVDMAVIIEKTPEQSKESI